MTDGPRSAIERFPLPSVETLARLPMVAQLVEQLGVDPQHLVEPDPALFRDLEERQYNVFFVQDARIRHSSRIKTTLSFRMGSARYWGSGGPCPRVSFSP